VADDRRIPASTASLGCSVLGHDPRRCVDET
jgi:hypothetical protein